MFSGFGFPSVSGFPTLGGVTCLDAAAALPAAAPVPATTTVESFTPFVQAANAGGFVNLGGDGMIPGGFPTSPEAAVASFAAVSPSLTSASMAPAPMTSAPYGAAAGYPAPPAPPAYAPAQYADPSVAYPPEYAANPALQPADLSVPAEYPPQAPIDVPEEDEPTAEHAGDHHKGCGHDFMTLGYWKIRGLAAPIRMLLAYAGVDYENKLFELGGEPGNWDRSEWLSKKAELKEDNPLINLPYFEDGAIVLSQSNAILKHLGRKLSLIGCSEIEAAKADMLLDQCMDVRSAVSRLCYFSTDFEKDKEEYYATTLPDQLQKFEDWFEAQGCAFLVEDTHPTTPDFVLWELLDIHDQMKPGFLEQFPRLQAFYELFRGLPQLHQYFESDLAKLPANNKMAHFK